MTDSLTYEKWNRLNADYLYRIQGKTAIVAFSGGKDSSVVLDLMKQAAAEYNFAIEAHAGTFPEHVLLAERREIIDAYWETRGLSIMWHKVAVSDGALDRALSEGKDPCRICNQEKKGAILKHFALRGQPHDLSVIIMGYSLWDIVSAVIEHLLAARFQTLGNISGDGKERLKGRYLETFQRFYPWMVFSSGLTVYKPLIWYNDQQIQAYIAENGLPISETPCRFKNFRPKRILSDYYSRMQLTFEYGRILDFVRNTLDLPEAADFENCDEQEYLKKLL